MEILSKLLAITPNFIIIGLITLFYTMEHLFNNEFTFNKMRHHLMQNILLGVVYSFGNLLWVIVTVFTIDG